MLWGLLRATNTVCALGSRVPVVARVFVPHLLHIPDLCVVVANHEARRYLREHGVHDSRAGVQHPHV